MRIVPSQTVTVATEKSLRLDRRLFSVARKWQFLQDGRGVSHRGKSWIRPGDSPTAAPDGFKS